LILDNCKIHHATLLEEMWKMLKNTYGIEHLFLPTYSPFLNPIEPSFNALKTTVRNAEFYNRGDLIRAIEQGISSTITAENVKKWFEHCVQFYQQCALGLPFTGKILAPDLANVDNVSKATDTTMEIIQAPQLMIEEIQ